MDHAARLDALRALLAQSGLDGILVAKPTNLRYLTRFTGSNGLCLITRSEAVFLTDSRYEKQAQDEVPDMDRRIVKGSLFKGLQAAGLPAAGRKIAFESGSLTYAQYQELAKTLAQVDWQPKANLVETLAIIKSEAEIGRIRAAAAMADEIFAEIVPLIKVGVTEIAIAAEILYRTKRRGADIAFDPIVASGRRSALPHGLAADKAIETGDLVVLDFGCKVRGYASDMTRTVVVGEASTEQRHIYDVVLDAQKRAIAATRADVAANRIDAAARDAIRDAGFGDHFGHALGHGLGLDVHAEPRIGPESESPVPAGAVITIEPGIYLPELGGVRIEDDLVVRRDHGEVLTQSRRDLIEISQR